MHEDITLPLFLKSLNILWAIYTQYVYCTRRLLNVCVCFTIYETINLLGKPVVRKFSLGLHVNVHVYCLHLFHYFQYRSAGSTKQAPWCQVVQNTYERLWIGCSKEVSNFQDRMIGGGPTSSHLQPPPRFHTPVVAQEKD